MSIKGAYNAAGYTWCFRSPLLHGLAFFSCAGVPNPDACLIFLLVSPIHYSYSLQKHSHKSKYFFPLTFPSLDATATIQVPHILYWRKHTQEEILYPSAPRTILYRIFPDTILALPIFSIEVHIQAEMSSKHNLGATLPLAPAHKPPFASVQPYPWRKYKRFSCRQYIRFPWRRYNLIWAPETYVTAPLAPWRCMSNLSTVASPWGVCCTCMYWINWKNRTHLW